MGQPTNGIAGIVTWNMGQLTCNMDIVVPWVGYGITWTALLHRAWVSRHNIVMVHGSANIWDCRNCTIEHGSADLQHGNHWSMKNGWAIPW